MASMPTGKGSGCVGFCSSGVRSCICPLGGHRPRGETMRGAITITTLKEFLGAFNAHDLDAIMEFFSDDCEFCMPRGKDPWGTRYVGKPAVREGLATRFVSIPDVHYGEDS